MGRKFVTYYYFSFKISQDFQNMVSKSTIPVHQDVTTVTPNIT